MPARELRGSFGFQDRQGCARGRLIVMAAKTKLTSNDFKTGMSIILSGSPYRVLGGCMSHEQC